MAIIDGATFRNGIFNGTWKIECIVFRYIYFMVQWVLWKHLNVSIQHAVCKMHFTCLHFEQVVNISVIFSKGNIQNKQQRNQQKKWTEYGKVFVFVLFLFAKLLFWENGVTVQYKRCHFTLLHHFALSFNALTIFYLFPNDPAGKN